MTHATCDVEGCETPSRATGLCGKHYQRVRATGTTDLASPPSFWDRVDKSGDCWLWMGFVHPAGYGRYSIAGKHWQAHRYALAEFQDIDGLEVDHKCHNRRCVRPDHLQAVSRKANSENLSGAYRNSKSGVRGVSWIAARRKYKAQVIHNGRTYWGGVYSNITDAENAARELRLRLHTNNLLDQAEEQR